MGRHFSRLLIGGFAVLLAGVAGSARADDWPQFRRDVTRSAASQDKLQFPLAEIWTWATQGERGHTPLYHAVAWRSRIFFTASEGRYRSLISADIKTGAVQWR